MPSLKKIKRKLIKLYQINFHRLFNSTNIETYGYCNRKCRFCFNNDRFPNREVGIMDQVIWERIIDELAEINFTARISPHFYGEPLLDKRMPFLIAYARKKCPLSYIQINSNGDLLTEKLLLKLISAGLNHIRITNYDDFEKEKLEKLIRKYPHHTSYRNYKELNIVNRAGILFDKANKNIDRPCLRPCNQLVINWKGNVLLCCNDYYENHILGNVKNEPLLKIWKTNRFRKYRRILKEKGGRRKIDICKNCDL